MQDAFEQALGSYSEEYLAAESTLLGGGKPAIDTLQANRNHPDPIAALMARCLLSWMQSNPPEYQGALDYLDYVPKKVERTPVTAPPAVGVATELSMRFGARPADLLALRLVKERNWPRWKVFGVLMYLKKERPHDTTEALIRFANETADEEARSYAVDVLEGYEDPALDRKIAAEHDRLEARGETLNSAIAELMVP